MQCPNTAAYTGAGNRAMALHESLPCQGKFIRLGSPESSNLIEISASGEEMLIASDDERPWILSQLVYQSGKFEDASVSETVG
jgi:hypothetical protein